MRRRLRLCNGDDSSCPCDCYGCEGFDHCRPEEPPAPWFWPAVSVVILGYLVLAVYVVYLLV
jgi:hypothetical protein